MNYQPPDPPGFGNCLTCGSLIDASEVRGDRCIECEDLREPEPIHPHNDGLDEYRKP